MGMGEEGPQAYNIKYLYKKFSLWLREYQHVIKVACSGCEILKLNN